MITWQEFLEKKNTNYDFSSTQVNLPSNLSDKILSWGKNNIPDDVLYDRKGFGREDEIHATVLFGLHDMQPNAVEKILQDAKPIKLELGKISLFSSDEYDVVKINVKSPDLHRLNTKLKSSLEYTSTHPGYKPHVTIAYVKKGEGKKYDGNKTFDGDDATIDEVIFSSKNGTKTKIRLG